MESQAFFQKIWHGFLKTEDNQIKEIDKKLNEIEYAYRVSLYSWDLAFSAAHEVSNPASLISFQNQETTSDSAGVALNRNTYKFGQFTFAHNQTVYDLSEWTNRTFLPGNAETLFEVKNSFIYKYDFLNRMGDVDYELISATRNYNELKTDLEQEQMYLDFFRAYIQAKSDLFVVKLTKEFEKRASKRVSVVAKRVRDGLSRRVELLQARSSLLTQEESLNTARSSLKSSIAVIEDILNMKIPESLMEQVIWPKRPLDYWGKAFNQDMTKAEQVIEAGVETANLELKRIEEQHGMKLELTASYIANSVNADRSEAFDAAAGEGDNISKSIALTWTIPLDLDRQDAIKQRILYTKKKNELELAKVKGDVAVQRNALREQIAFLDEAYERASKKIALADDILKQQNQLYYRGQATFDDVIRADEAYINAQLSRSKIIAQYDLLLSQYAYLHNGIVEFLNRYTD